VDEEWVAYSLELWTQTPYERDGQKVGLRNSGWPDAVESGLLRGREEGGVIVSVACCREDYWHEACSIALVLSCGLFNVDVC